MVKIVKEVYMAEVDSVRPKIIYLQDFLFDKAMSFPLEKKISPEYKKYRITVEEIKDK